MTPRFLELFLVAILEKGDLRDNLEALILLYVIDIFCDNRPLAIIQIKKSHPWCHISPLPHHDQPPPAAQPEEPRLSFFEKLRFRDGLVWTVGLNGRRNKVLRCSVYRT